jgi:hypothetical protein
MKVRNKIIRNTDMASSILLKFPRNTEINETKKAEVSEALSRVRRPLDSTKVNFKVMGVYGLPEVWKSKLVSKIDFVNVTVIE